MILIETQAVVSFVTLTKLFYGAFPTVGLSVAIFFVFATLNQKRISTTIPNATLPF